MKADRVWMVCPVRPNGLQVNLSRMVFTVGRRSMSRSRWFELKGKA